mmetsp:Transcript_14620/g.25267  ORF Transcript_14620/g.25267 Transcript_14620/m.25267 type:complete len:124 (-) Transcript_14620:2845-3216(-)
MTNFDQCPSVKIKSFFAVEPHDRSPRKRIFAHPMLEYSFVPIWYCETDQTSQCYKQTNPTQTKPTSPRSSQASSKGACTYIINLPTISTFVKQQIYLNESVTTKEREINARKPNRIVPRTRFL